jgi:hypothetical protein
LPSRPTRSAARSEARQAGYFNDRDREFHPTFDRHVDLLLIEAFRTGQRVAS